jgi:hypothetical protein
MHTPGRCIASQGEYFAGDHTFTMIEFTNFIFRPRNAQVHFTEAVKRFTGGKN